MSNTLFKPEDRFSDYELMRMLDSGGMGEVWKASQIHSHQKVAIKFIRSSLIEDPVSKNRFLQEARTLARLEHDRIVPFYGVREDHGRFAIVLRFVDGESLARRIDRLGPLPLDMAMVCARDVLRALSYAHENEVVHRDIKPHNILIGLTHHQECFFLSDFGISLTEFDERNTDSRSSLGTLHYMSPEQFDAVHKLDAHRGGRHSDIYSFGIVLFEMLTGRLPFGNRRSRNDSYATIAAMHCNAPVPRLRDFHADFGPGIAPVEDVVAQCLEKLSENRPQNCMSLLEKLERAFASVSDYSAHPATQLVSLNHEQTLAVRHSDEKTSNRAADDAFNAEVPKPAEKASETGNSRREVEARKAEEEARATEAARKADEAKRLEEARKLGEARHAEELQNAAAARQTAATDNTRKLAFAGVAVIVLAAAGYTLLHQFTNKAPPSAKQPMPIVWRNVPWNSDLLKDCGKLADPDSKTCLARKNLSERLQAVTDWKTVQASDPLLSDCMAMAACTAASQSAAAGVANHKSTEAKQPVRPAKANTENSPEQDKTQFDKVPGQSTYNMNH